MPRFGLPPSRSMYQLMRSASDLNAAGPALALRLAVIVGVGVDGLATGDLGRGSGV